MALTMDTQVDDKVFLKDVPYSWRSPSYVASSYSLNNLSIEIFYREISGYELPSTPISYITRGIIAGRFFVAKLCVSMRTRTLGYPFINSGIPFDKLESMISGVLKHVLYISEEDYNLELTEYLKILPPELGITGST